MEIQYFNRYTNNIEVEKVYGDKAVRWLYESNTGKFLSKIVSAAPFSQFYGYLQSSPSSKSKVQPFIKNFNIPISDFLPEEGYSEADPYPNFNSFFIRRFKPGKRSFIDESNVMPACSEARYFGYSEINSDLVVPVKGRYLAADSLIQNEKWNKTFENGPLLIARLCPVDYHRFHYPDTGTTLDAYRVPGELHSVNPIALKKRPDIFIRNERVVSILETKNFGKLAYIEVGATCVGKIVQSHKSNDFQRGDEKGYFLFGGSTVILVGEKGAWKPSDDILENTSKGIETYSHLGDKLAVKN